MHWVLHWELHGVSERKCQVQDVSKTYHQRKAFWTLDSAVYDMGCKLPSLEKWDPISLRNTHKFQFRHKKHVEASYDSDLFPGIFPPRILASSVPLRRATLCGLDTETSYVSRLAPVCGLQFLKLSWPCLDTLTKRWLRCSCRDLAGKVANLAVGQISAFGVSACASPSFSRQSETWTCLCDLSDFLRWFEFGVAMISAAPKISCLYSASWRILKTSETWCWLGTMTSWRSAVYIHRYRTYHTGCTDLPGHPINYQSRDKRRDESVWVLGFMQHPLSLHYQESKSHTERQRRNAMSSEFLWAIQSHGSLDYWEILCQQNSSRMFTIVSPSILNCCFYNLQLQTL